MKDTVISLFDLTGEMVRPWTQKGYWGFCFDIQHPEGVETEIHPGAIGIHRDLMRPFRAADLEAYGIEPDRVAAVFAFPPCTHLAVSGARWFKGKGLRALASSVDMFATAAELAEELGAPYFLENPVSTISTYWRKADFSFDPYEYGGWIPAGEEVHPKYPGIISDADRYHKKTCLWTGGGFVMPEKRPVAEPVRDALGFSGDQFKTIGFNHPETANVRSATPRGFARAVFAANHNPENLKGE